MNVHRNKLVSVFQWGTEKGALDPHKEENIMERRAQSLEWRRQIPSLTLTTCVMLSQLFTFHFSRFFIVSKEIINNSVYYKR